VLSCAVKTILLVNRMSIAEGWVEDKLLALTKVFCIDVCAYAVMSNQQNVGTFYNSAAGPEGGRQDA
jgi:hypothetical protein|tara:strand:+ start:838 stop:1038 length:201 start_codon:yes stop_codon:yes gene_type:complete